MPHDPPPDERTALLRQKNAVGQQASLRRELTSRQVSMIAVGAPPGSILTVQP